MSVQIEVPTKYLNAIKLFTSKADEREYLAGIFVEAWPGEARLVATDGAILGCCRVQHDQQDITPVSAIIPKKAFDLIANTKGCSNAYITIEPERYEVTCCGVHTSGATINAQYPNYRKLLKIKSSGEPAHYNSNYVATIAKAWDILCDKRRPCLATITPNGDGPGLISFGLADFFGILMPMRVDGDMILAEVPEWATQTWRE